MTTQLKKIALCLTLACFSFGLKADDSQSAQIFYSFEANGDDYITGVGVGYSFTNPVSGLGYQVTTSLSSAEVMATDGYIEDYVAWEAGVKLGLFSTIAIYAEAGIDLTELLVHDIKYGDHHEYYYDNRYEENHEDIDTYLGIGAGFDLGSVRITAFSRFRNIDSEYWEAASDKFSGIQVSASF